jgi:UDP-N-acetylglucosamine 2-epimerase (non-hydrolysing)
MKIMSVVGARPNFMKIAPFINAIDNYNSSLSSPHNKVEHILVHTGQHYDIRMSQAFFVALGIPDPAINLEVGSGSHAEQVGQTMIAFEKVVLENKPDWVIVVGDVNATLACSVTAKKLGVKVCHIEAGLRSGDLSMPEEINRLVTDRLSDLLLTPDEISSENLRNEGTPESRIRFVGNIMIDTLEANREKARELSIGRIIRENLHKEIEVPYRNPQIDEYSIITLHRPSNVDLPEILDPLVQFLLDDVAPKFTLFWPVHPRTLNRLKSFNLWNKLKENKNVVVLEPIGYLEMLHLNMNARLMLTDSGGLQEECCVLGTPCLTLRWNTERPITLREHGGASVLVGNNIERIRTEYYQTIAMENRPSRPELWDGYTAERCLRAILEA